MHVCSHSHIYMHKLRHEKKIFAYAKTKALITAKLICAFVFATGIVQFLYFLNPKFQASTHLLCLYSYVCVRPGRNPEDRFSRIAAHMVKTVVPHVCLYMNRLVGKPTMWFPNRSDTNQAVQSQKIARGSKFRI